MESISAISLEEVVELVEVFRLQLADGLELLYYALHQLMLLEIPLKRFSVLLPWALWKLGSHQLVNLISLVDFASDVLH
jgi:hypothetical protein